MEYDQERIFKHLCALFSGGENHCTTCFFKQVFLLGYTSERSREWTIHYFKARRCDYEKVRPAPPIDGIY